MTATIQKRIQDITSCTIGTNSFKDFSSIDFSKGGSNIDVFSNGSSGVSFRMMTKFEPSATLNFNGLPVELYNTIAGTTVSTFIVTCRIAGDSANELKYSLNANSYAVIGYPQQKDSTQNLSTCDIEIKFYNTSGSNPIKKEVVAKT